jgi:D-alanyl-D-alanine carboxypeptidase/D-alanyl-D-alanine-endopeptidase (penicillin-binding protein 4)
MIGAARGFEPRGRGPRAALHLLLLVAIGGCHLHPPALPALHAHSSLQGAIDATLDDPALARGTWGVVVRSLKTGETVFERNPQKLLMPASNMKIATLAAAADRLGWSFAYATRLAMSGSIQNGVLDGDLVVVGSGDPTIGGIDGIADRLFADWAERLSRLGIRAIGGRIVGDDNAFDDEELGFGWSWDDLADDYAAGVSALQYNENAVRISIAPGPAAGDSAATTADPAASGVEVVNLVRTGPAGGAPTVHARRLPGRERLELTGSISLGSAPAILTVSVDNPTLFFVRAFRRALIADGIDVRGAAVDTDAIDDPPRAPLTAIASSRSAALSTMAARLMKASQNQYAETLLKTLASAGGQTGSAAAGRAVLQDVFTAWGLSSAGFIVRDGSGLSRYDYISAEALAGILAHVYGDDRLREPFLASLPVAGRDGTLANRMKETAAEGNVRAKTGSMSNVRALSGYVTTADGEPLAFAIIANNFETTADVVNRATDEIVLKLAEFKTIGTQRPQR